jgi:WhiB family redox-sensing transcriptional regulator
MTKAISTELRRLRQAGRQQPRVPSMPWAVRAACQAHDPEGWIDDRPGRPTAAARAVCAACQAHDPEGWIDDRPGRPTAAARAVCAACPVRAACLAHALAYEEPWGMWGGRTTRERVAKRLFEPVHQLFDGEGQSVGRVPLNFSPRMDDLIPQFD